MITNSTHKPINPYGKRQISFGAIPVVKGNIVKRFADGSEKFIPVEFSVLEPKDASLLEQYVPDWLGSKYGMHIIRSFQKFVSQQLPEYPLLDNIGYFWIKPSKVVEAPPLCLMQISMDKTHGVSLELLQASNTVMNSKHSKEVFSGVGQMAMYGLTKFVRTLNLPYFSIGSTNNSFYRKVFGFEEPIINPNIKIAKERFKPFLLRTQRKYHFEDTLRLSQNALEKIKENML